MNDRNNKVSEYFRSLSSNIDKAYLSWANSQKAEFPQLFCYIEGEDVLDPTYQHAARYGLTLITHTIHEIWSYAGDIVGHDVDEERGKSNDNFMHLTSMEFLPKEVARHCISSSRLLTYQATAHKSAADDSPELISDIDFSKALIDMFSTDGKMCDSLFMHASEEFGLGMVPDRSIYVPLQYRRDVYKKLLATLFSSFEKIESADSGVKLIRDVHEALANKVGVTAFRNLAATRPCNPNGCSMHSYHYEHSLCQYD